MVLLALALPACAVGGGGEASAPPTSHTTGTGTPATVVEETSTTTSTAAPRGTAARSSTTTTPVTTPPRPLVLSPIARVDDRAGDHGLNGPPQADLSAIELSGNDDVARITVVLAGPVPGRLADTDVEGVGVDLFAPGNTDPHRSDAQVFAAGDSSGWYGYLAVGTGSPVALPGTLTIDGDRIVFELSWRDLRAPERGSFSGFVDFSRDAPIRNQTTQDRAPDLGTTPYASHASGGRRDQGA